MNDHRISREHLASIADAADRLAEMCRVALQYAPEPKRPKPMVTGERVFTALAELGGRADIGLLSESLTGIDKHSTRSHIGTHLMRMVRDGKVVKVGAGVYRLP